MINALRLINFKRFLDLELRMTKLTLLTGLNSGGKSSIIQALLLLHSEVLPGGAVPLNGPFGLALGEARDVLNADAPSTTIEIRASSESGEVRLVAVVPDERSPSLIAEAMGPFDGLVSMDDDQRGLEYLCAERLGPRDLLEVSSRFEGELSVGAQGEFTAHVLDQLSQLRIDQNRLFPAASDDEPIVTLRSQVEAWMSAIVSPLRIEARWISGTSAATLRFKSPDILTDWLRPTNVGFGISYALPIVVAALTVADGGLLLVENPEAHLHPAGQSAMGRFLGRIASAGVQLVVETHSDHILSGVRQAVGVDSVLAPESVVVHYFGTSSDPETLTLDESGSLSSWPTGFFDQIETDLAELARAKRQ